MKNIEELIVLRPGTGIGKAPFDRKRAIALGAALAIGWLGIEAPAKADDWDYSQQLRNFENQMRWEMEQERRQLQIEMEQERPRWHRYGEGREI